MSGWTLRAKQAPALRADLRAVTPQALTGLAAAEIERLPIGHGNVLLPLAEFFHVQAREDDTLVFAADLARFDRVGWQMDGGTLMVEGDVGHYAGAGMRAGSLHVDGHSGQLAACEMRGGTLTIGGNTGDFAASTLPGSMEGMRGGTLVVKGHAGERFGDRMRRGTAIVFGNAGSFLGSRMVAGTIAVGGQVGQHCAYGMRRGSMVLVSAAPLASPTFVPAGADAPVLWQLLARSLAHHGGVFAELPQRGIDRQLGDLAADGKGELIFLR